MPKRAAEDVHPKKMSGSSEAAIAPTKKAKNGKPKATIIDIPNQLGTDAFREQYIRPQWLGQPAATSEPAFPDGAGFHLTYKRSKDMTAVETLKCLNLVKTTSKHDYDASSDGWSDERKRKELEDKDMRFLLVYREGQDRIEGFLSFMLTHDSTPSVPVLYIYEIHLDEALRRLGMGKHLMQVAEGIAQNVGVEKVMLTCFLSNLKAHNFYTRLEYGTDECSPEDRTTRRKTIKVTYVIMSKRVSSISRNQKPK